MTKEEKELLLKDLYAKLPYGLVINIGDKDLKLDRQHQNIGILYPEDCSKEFNERNNNSAFYIIISGCYYGEDIKPYLHPISSITEEERKACADFIYKQSDESCWIDEYGSLNLYGGNKFIDAYTFSCYLDWLNEHHFDYRGLIEKNLALEAPYGMYN